MKEIQHLQLPLRALGIGTYVTNPTAENPFHPISVAHMDTSVFDVVHMFSEKSISAVPIVDADGIVVNLYETVDVIVRVFEASQMRDLRLADARPPRRLPGAQLDGSRGSQSAREGLPRRRYLHCV